jgi:hypothetical protein
MSYEVIFRVCNGVQKRLGASVMLLIESRKSLWGFLGVVHATTGCHRHAETLEVY